MFILVSYDIAETEHKSGRRRLRKVARLCENVGQRVQYSVFEVHVDRTRWTRLRRDLLAAVDLDKDSLRFYFLGDATLHEHHGVKPSFNFDGPLIL